MGHLVRPGRARACCKAVCAAACLVVAALFLVFPSRPAAGSSGKRYAVIVGVSNYTAGLPVLKTAVNDAILLADVLTTVEVVGQPYQVEGLFLDGMDRREEQLKQCRDLGARVKVEEAMPGNILDRLLGLQNVVKPEDSLLFFFSGHGQKSGQDTYLALAKWDPLRPSPNRQGIPFTELTRLLKKIQCRARICVMDCCYSGALEGKAGEGGGLDGASLDALRSEDDSDTGAFVLASSGEKQKSYENAQSGHGFFTEAFVEGLRGKAKRDGSGGISVLAAFNYVVREVPTRVKARFGSSLQNPQLRVFGPGMDEVYLAHLPRSASPEATPTAPMLALLCGPGFFDPKSNKQRVVECLGSPPCLADARAYYRDPDRVGRHPATDDVYFSIPENVVASFEAAKRYFSRKARQKYFCSLCRSVAAGPGKCSECGADLIASKEGVLPAESATPTPAPEPTPSAPLTPPEPTPTASTR
ncbi:MAG: caspase family protein [Candidatus Riflebacteria bacterium]|nr:caspase family protein [Candidatus Riflebacteria bacterium]